MQNSDKEKQDQRITCNMEDSNMTIEFLRAWLLSERSVSKSARQRDDELARRICLNVLLRRPFEVAELEEQLRIVSVQRRRAEKATTDVLAILENNGVSDVSEELDSSFWTKTRLLSPTWIMFLLKERRALYVQKGEEKRQRNFRVLMIFLQYLVEACLGKASRVLLILLNIIKTHL